MWGKITHRLRFAREIYIGRWRWIWFVVWGFPYGFASLYDFIRGEYFPKLLALSELFPPWILSVWLVLGIIAFITITFEVAYQVSHKSGVNLFKIVGQKIVSLPAHALEDGKLHLVPCSVGFNSIELKNLRGLMTISKLTLSPNILCEKDNERWETTDAFQTISTPLFKNPDKIPKYYLKSFSQPLARDLGWDVQDKEQWVMTGLPLNIAEGQSLPLPAIYVSVANWDEAEQHFEKREQCILKTSIIIWTDRGYQQLEHTISLVTIRGLPNEPLFTLDSIV
jgi:hypothetical protein